MRLIFTIVLISVFSSFAQNPGDIIITEIMQNPAAVTDANGEWFEIFNTTSTAIDIDGWIVRDDGTDTHTINNGGPLLISAQGFLVLGNNGDTGTNGGVTEDYVYGSGWFLANGADEVYIATSGGTIIDSVWYDGGPNFPDPTGSSMVFVGPYLGGLAHTANDTGSNWVTTSNIPAHQLSGGDYGTPGFLGNDASLPINLSSFTARAGDRVVTLKWITESEKDNVGFEIQRSNEESGNYETIASYVNNENLRGKINSNSRTVYKFTDEVVGNDITYWYKLVDVDLNGVKTFHGPISATPHAVGNPVINTGPGNLPETFNLRQNYPNPFNPNTTISFDIPQLNNGNVAATLYIYNSLGQQVKVLYQGKIAPGTYTVDWDGTNKNSKALPSGLYYATLKADYYSKTIKMMYMK